LVDTVKLDDSGEVESWVFTAKTGHVTSKKRAQGRAKIAERFDSFALANPRNTERFVALLTPTRPQVGECPEERVVLDQKALREAILLAGSSQEMTQELLGATLQCYLRPQNGSNSFLRACYRCQGEGPPSYSLHRVSPMYRVPDSVDRLAAAEGAAVPRSESIVEGADPESVRLRSETEGALGSLVAFLTTRLACEVGNEGRQQKVLTCKADFVVDDNGELWLTSLPSVTVPSTPGIGPSNPSILSSELSTFPSSDDTSYSREERQGCIDGGKEGGVGVSNPSSVHMPPLLGNTPVVPQIAAPLDGSGSTPLGSARHQPTSARSNGQSITEDISVRKQLANNEGSSVTGELPAIPSTMLGPRSVSGDHNSRSRGQEGDGERAPIIEKKGGVYVANVHSSALRGLCCWRERPVDRRGSASHGRDSPRWQLVEARYKGNLASEEHRGDGSDAGSADAAFEGTSSPASFDELSKARFKMTARSVLLARAVESFLWGEEPLHIGADDRKRGYGVKGGSGTNFSLSQRWREYDQHAQLSLASANPQAYYNEVTVCGNCMEICRKLDSIRASGFPDPAGAALAGGATTAGATWSSGDASSLSGEPALRPRSEPLPECIAATTGNERRPGTAATGREAGAAAITANNSRPGPPGEAVDPDGNTTHEERDAVVMERDARRGDDLEGSQIVRPNENVESSSLGESTPKRSGGEVSTSAGPKPEKDVDITAEGSEEAGLVGTARMARSGNEKASPVRLEKRNTSKAIMERMLSVYGEGTKTGGRNHAKLGGSNKSKKGTSKKTSGGGGAVGGELPNVATIARFAIERERLAREIGVDELGGPATLGVVNVGVTAAAHGRRQNKGNPNDEVGGVGSKRVKYHQHRRGKGDDVDGSSGVGDYRAGENTANPLPAASGALAGEKIAGETLLDRLESVAEARSIESAGGVHGGGSRAEDYVKHDDWRHNAEEESSLFSDPARNNRPRVAGGEAAWDPAPPPLAAELSTTESAFLERSRRHVGLDGGGAAASGLRGGDDSLFGNHFEAGFRNESGGVDGTGSSGVGRSDGGGGGHVATIGALRDRLASVEGENAALRARARRAEEQRAAEAARGDRASKKLAQARTEFSRAMSEKDEDYRRRELALEERHSRELAKKTQASAEEMMVEVSGSGEESEGLGAGQGGDRKAIAPGAMERKSSKSLIARLDQAFRDMAEQQRRFAQTKRNLLAEKTMEVAAAEAKGRRELQEARTLAAAMEDKAASLQEHVSEAAKKISTFKAMEEEQRKRRQSAEEDTDKIRKEISVLRQTVQASQSVDMADESGGRRDAQSTLAAMTATSEARIRTLNNKVEFLKAQLASEQTLKAEVEAALALSRKSVFEAKDESRKQAAAADKAREAAVEEAVSRVNRQVEESMSETYRVQSKVQTLQDQLSDALGDLSMARRREEALKAEVAVMATKLEDRGTELAKAQ
ncbi:unnamed protein product, partial [Ectocarpus sp. 12 AP-2014]